MQNEVRETSPTETKPAPTPTQTHTGEQSTQVENTLRGNLQSAATLYTNAGKAGAASTLEIREKPAEGAGYGANPLRVVVGVENVSLANAARIAQPYAAAVGRKLSGLSDVFAALESAGLAYAPNKTTTDGKPLRSSLGEFVWGAKSKEDILQRLKNDLSTYTTHLNAALAGKNKRNPDTLRERIAAMNRVLSIAKNHPLL